MKIQNEQGRTMLEMLGVLAIMGIITYGAIAGINYGMSSYKINQTYSEVQDVIHGVEDLYSWSKGYPTGASEIMQAACVNDIFSKKCNSANTEVMSAFGEMHVQGIDGGNNFEVTVSITDADERTRLGDMDWDGINVEHDCTSRSNICVFWPK